MRHKRSFSGNLLRVLKSPSTWTLPRSPLSPKFIGYLEEEDYGYPPTHQRADESIASALEETRELKYEEEDESSSDDDSDFSICVAKEVRLERSKGLRIINIRHRHEHSDPKFHEYGETPVHEEVHTRPSSTPSTFQGFEKAIEQQFGTEVADDLSHTSSTPERRRDAIWMAPPASPQTPLKKTGFHRIVDLAKKIPGTPRSPSPQAPRVAMEEIRRSWLVADQWLNDNGEVEATFEEKAESIMEMPPPCTAKIDIRMETHRNQYGRFGNNGQRWSSSAYEGIKWFDKV